MVDKLRISLEDLQIAVDQLDQTVEVMSKLIKRIKYSLHDVDTATASFFTGDALDDFSHLLTGGGENLH